MWFTELAVPQTVMVVDLGGGTFDLSLDKYQKNEVSVLARSSHLALVVAVGTAPVGSSDIEPERSSTRWMFGFVRVTVMAKACCPHVWPGGGGDHGPAMSGEGAG